MCEIGTANTVRSSWGTWASCEGGVRATWTIWTSWSVGAGSIGKVRAAWVLLIAKVLRTSFSLVVIENVEEEVIELGVILDLFNILAVTMSADDIIEGLTSQLKASLILSGINLEGKGSILDNI
jgi:hypothetical protein